MSTELSEAPRPRPEIPAVRLGAEPWGSSRLHLGTGTLWELLAFFGTGNEITGPTEPGIRMGNLGILLEICQNQLFVSR